MSAAVSASLNKLGDLSDVLLANHNGGPILLGIRGVAGATIRLEKSVNADFSAPSTVVDRTADQAMTLEVTSVAGDRFRVKCQVAPTAGATVQVRLSKETSSTI